MEGSRIVRISVTWRGRQLDVVEDPSCTVKEFGQLLQDLTSVKPETLKLIVPQSTNKGSKLITPFSDPHSRLTLNEADISEVRCGYWLARAIRILIGVSLASGYCNGSWRVKSL